MTDRSFHPFGLAVNKRFMELADKGIMFRAGNDEEALWDTYINAFPEGTNPVYIVNSQHDCSCCKNFIKHLGNAVGIVNNKIVTLWSLTGLETPYKEVAEAMDAYVRKQHLDGILCKGEPSYGAEKTRQTTGSGQVVTWNHFFAKLPEKVYSKDAAKEIGEAATTIAVFKRGLEELTLEAFTTALTLLEGEEPLYRGEEFRNHLTEFSKLHKAYSKLTTRRDKEVFLYKNYTMFCSRIRNGAIGTLLKDLSGGEELDIAVAKFESVMAGPNYKRSKSIITERMVEDAMKTVREEWIEAALHRRYAKRSDLSVNNLLWVDNTAKKDLGDVTGTLMKAAVKKSPTRQAVEGQVNIDEFLRDILPQASGLEVYVSNDHVPKMMSLTTAEESSAPNVFKWKNPFGWSYSGEFTDSIKERVKRAGGNVGAKLRFSLSWFNTDDLDIHVETPSGTHIFYGNPQDKFGNHVLDVDMNRSAFDLTDTQVENLAFTNPEDGLYKLYVHQFSRRGNSDVGFVIEVESGGKIKQFSYKDDIYQNGNVAVGEFTVTKGTISGADINRSLTGGNMPQEVWGIKTEGFVKAHSVVLSPNHWDDQEVGNKHYFFLLENCVNPDKTRGIYNEFLKKSLDKHRKVFEVLGGKIRCPESNEQLSGLGFSSTNGDLFKVRVSSRSGAKSVYNVKI